MKNIKDKKNQTKSRSFKLTPIRLSMIVLVSAFMAWIVYSASAATGSFTLSADKTSITQGSDVYVTLTANSDAGVTIANAVISYDSSKLTYGGADYTNSKLTSDSPEATTSPGSITISRYTTGSYPTGSVFVAKLKFTAKVGSGNVAINLAQSPTSAIYTDESGGGIASVSAKSVTIALTAPQVPASPTQPTVSPNPATPTQQPVQNVTRPTPTQTPAPATPPQSSNTTTLVPDTTTTPAPEVYYPQTSIPKPGTSYVSTKPSLFARLSKLLKVIIPIVVISGITGGAVWFVMSRTNHNSMHGFTGAVHSSPTPGTVTSVTPPSNNGSSPNNYVNKPNVGSNNNNDNTPKTFSGL
ncbi:MAG: hypothetical protein U0413_02015 [Candidatus Saccharimonadales bacterium]